MDYEAIIMGMLNSQLTSQVTKAQQAQQREDFGVPNSTRRPFESRMKTEAAVYRVAAQNMEDGSAMVHMAQTGVTAIKSQLKDVEEILTDASAQDSMTIDDYKEVNKTLAKRFEEIEKIAQNTTFNGMSLLDGTAGNNGVVTLQAGCSPRNQKFMNLLDGSGSAYSAGNQSMDLSFDTLFGNSTLTIATTPPPSTPQRIGFLAIDTSSDAATANTSAQNALKLVKKYIEGIAGLEAQYSYDIKSLDNLGLLFEEQADIFEDAAKRASDSGSSSADPSTMSRSEILSQLLATNPSILSGTT